MKPLIHFQQFLHRRGLVIIVSDFWHEPDVIVKAVAPLRFHGNEVVLFHVLDPQKIQPKLNEPVLLVDMETQDTHWFGRMEPISIQPLYTTGRGTSTNSESLRDNGCR
jgi:hypothetical protein